MVTPQDLFDKIRETVVYSEQQKILEENEHLLDNELAHLLRKAADEFLHSKLERSDQFADLLLYQAEQMENSQIKALGLRVKANVYAIGRGKFEQGIQYYDQAAEIYEELGLFDQKAASQVGKVAACANLGRYQEALDIYEWAVPILEEHHEWLRLGHLHLNIGSHVFGRPGLDEAALVCFERARECYERLGEEGAEGVAWVIQNCANLLRNQGKFEEAIDYSERAYEILSKLGQPIEAARALDIMAQSYIVLGRHNDALLRLTESRKIFEADGRPYDVALIDLDIANCLLQLRRFADVLINCRQCRTYFEEQSVYFELGQSFLYEATALIHLKNYKDALAMLDNAYHHFVQQSPTWATIALLEQATALYKLDSYTESLATAQKCLAYLEQYELPIQTIQAYLVGGHAAIAALDISHVQQFLDKAQRLIQRHDIPTLLYEYYHLQGELYYKKSETADALAAYEEAIEYLERQRSQLMVEFRADFLTDKELIYQDIVALHLESDRPDLGLKYVERAKSRALLDLLSHHIDISVQSRSAEDAPLVAHLAELRQRWDALYYSQFAGQERLQLRDVQLPSDQNHQAEQTVLGLEKEIMDSWHQLLVHNADYASDAALWQVRVESAQPYLDEKTVLLEYFVIRDQLWLFTISAKDVQAYPLPTTMTKTQGTLNRLWKKLIGTTSQPMSRMPRWIKQTQKLLQRLYDNLIAPVQEVIAKYHHIYIVPHGSLHYIPFHALHNGKSYLIKEHTISYLPSASYLHYCQHSASGKNCQIFAHTSGQQLPSTIQEAQIIGQLLGGQVYLEEHATIRTLREVATDCGILHLATHGDFRADNPLFSGLVLDDGLLTTLDIFNLRLNSALITLSACQTGRNVVGGGDELLGLSRAFLSAGANALLLTMWAVEDHSTALLMESFYKKIKMGQSKSTALREAQLELMDHEDYGHPYFWAPFILVGNIERVGFT